MLTRALSYAVSAGCSMSSSVKVRCPVDSLPRVSVISPDTLRVLKVIVAACDFCAISRPVSRAPGAAVSTNNMSTGQAIVRILKSFHPARVGEQQERENEQVTEHRQDQADCGQSSE